MKLLAVIVVLSRIIARNTTGNTKELVEYVVCISSFTLICVILFS